MMAHRPLLAPLLCIVNLAMGSITALTPQMGWNSWNVYKSNINESIIEQTAELLVSTGLRDAGYEYLILDAGWQSSTRAEDGQQRANATRFPKGIPAVADFAHQRQLKLGIYSDSGIYDCTFNPGSWGYEERDARTYAEWGVDLLKYDNCGGFEAGTLSSPARFAVMRDALLNSGRDILYALCQWGHQFPWYWADQVGHSYRMSGDITAKYSDTGSDCACRTAYCLNTGYAGCSVLTIIRKMREIAPFQKPGAWADMDMLEIGNVNMTLQQQRTHFSFWAALKSPLLIGADLASLPHESLAVLKNKEMIAISQDAQGQAAQFVPSLSEEHSHQVWTGELSGDRRVVLALNEGNQTVTMKLPFAHIPGLRSGQRYRVRDVWAARNSTARNHASYSLRPDETKVLVFEEG